MNDLSVIEKEFGKLDAFQAENPAFWVARPNEALPFIASLKDSVVKTIGTSAGGRDIIAIEYGEKEPLETLTDNLNSALASARVPPDPTLIYPECFYGAKRRVRPVVVLQGAIHGEELTGTVASLNLCQIIETGCDLRGREWPRLAELARGMRICVIPWMNPDGTTRFPLSNPTAAPHALTSRLSQGVTSDGKAYTYPSVKKIQPIPPATTAYMGTYYNDNGVNLQYDLMNVDRQPETSAWMKYYLEERPDGVVIWHCDSGSMMGAPEYYLPPGHQIELSRLAGAVRARMQREGYGTRTHRLSWQLPGMGKPFLEQIAGTYHVSGATPIMCELPMGPLEYPFSCDELLDIGLMTIEEILNYADTDGLRAYETWSKVRGPR